MNDAQTYLQFAEQALNNNPNPKTIGKYAVLMLACIADQLKELVNISRNQK